VLAKRKVAGGDILAVVVVDLVWDVERKTQGERVFMRGLTAEAQMCSFYSRTYYQPWKA